jgi:peptidoglycan/xylan/chitin deacetylase (PgdA/CDA1 family)
VIRRALRLAAAALVLAVGLFALYEVVERPASGLFGAVILHGSGHRVALTFDDGPNPAYTPAVLATLRAHHVHATFFCVGRAVRAHPDLVRAIVAGGNEIENHTLTHAHLNALFTRAALAAQIGGGSRAIAAVTGRAPRFTRPPYGARDFAALATIRALGMRTVLWSAMLGDYATPPDRATLLQALLAQIGDGAIVVLHDGDLGRDDDGGRTYEAALAGPLIDALQARGYTFVTVADLALTRTGGR